MLAALSPVNLIWKGNSFFDSFLCPVEIDHIFVAVYSDCVCVLCVCVCVCVRVCVCV